MSLISVGPTLFGTETRVWRVTAALTAFVGGTGVLIGRTLMYLFAGLSLGFIADTLLVRLRGGS
jgi:hypothetical protein